MNVAELMVECIEAEGVEYIFGVPGEENEDFLFAIEKSNITFVPVRHEQGAAFIADVWGRLTGKAGVCLSTLGPGATNLMTGIADANLDKAPLVALTGQGSSDRLHHESHQMIDVIRMMEPITKWNGTVNSEDVVLEMVRKAFKLAQAEKPGATHLELPENIAKVQIKNDHKPLKINKIRRPSPDPAAIEEAVQMIKAADRPIIIAGNGAIRTRASKALTQLSTNHNIPVASTFMAKGSISDLSETSLASVGLGFKDYVIEAFEKADVVISIGYDVAEYDPVNWNQDLNKTIIHLDFEPAEIYQHYNPDLEVIGDIAASIEELNSGLHDVQFQKWYEDIRIRIFKSFDEYKLNDEKAFTAPGVIHAVREILPENGLVISDVGSHKMWIARNYPTYAPNGCIISNGLASMGIALPGVIAAKLIDAKRPVVSIMGDGGAMMNIQELETAVRLNISGVIIILNDNNYGLIEWKQEMNEGKSFGTRIGNPDFIKLAESFGIESYKPSKVSELKHILEQAITKQKLVLIEIPIETDVNNHLIESLETYFN